MNEIILAIAMICQPSTSIWDRTQASARCSKRILECYAKDEKTNLNNKAEMLKFAKCLEEK